jgi:hypothetical protein
MFLQVMPGLIGDFDTVGGDEKQYSGGAGGIRTLDRALQPYNGLANRRLQPLGHSSVRPICPTWRRAASGRFSSWQGDLEAGLPHTPAIKQIQRATMPFRSLLQGVFSLSQA